MPAQACHAVASLKAWGEECADLCMRHGHLSPSGDPNFRLLYSSVETLETPGGVMFLGTNPGGDLTIARGSHRRLPFEKPRWSAYMDEDWNGHALQPAAREIANLFAGPRESGEGVLRRSPSGNLIPFRSESGSSSWRSPGPWFCSRATGHTGVNWRRCSISHRNRRRTAATSARAGFGRQSRSAEADRSTCSRFHG